MGRTVCRSSKRWSKSSRKKAATRSSARSRARTWSAGRMTARSTSCRRRAYPAGYPAEIADVVVKQKWAPAKSAREVHRVVAWEAVGETEGTGIVHIAPGCGKEDFQLGKKEGLPPVAPLDESGCLPQGFGDLAGKSAVDPATTDWILANLKEKGLLLAVEKYPHKLPALLALQDRTALPPGGRVVHQHEAGATRSWRSSRTGDVPARVDQRQGPRAGLADEHGRLDDLEEALLGPRPADLGRRVTGDFEVIGSRAELEDAGRRGLGPVRRSFAAPAVDRQGEDQEPEDRQPDVAHPRRRQSLARRRHRPVFDDGLQQGPRRMGEVVPGRLHHGGFPGPVPQLVLRHARHEHDDGEAGRRSRCCSGTAWCATSTARRCTNRRATRSRSMGPRTSRLPHIKRQDASPASVCRQCIRRWAPTSCAGCIAATTRRRTSTSAHGPAKELRSKFMLKLWNTYAFFCNYARLDGFDPAAPQVPRRRSGPTSTAGSCPICNC